MVKPKVVTFDCAQTLVHVDWKMGQFARDCALHAGLQVSEDASILYADLYRERHDKYLAVNLTKDHGACKGFWDDLGVDWLRALGYEESWLSRINSAADELGFGPRSKIFKIYPDVIPALERLKANGVRLAVISNWDYSLHRVLRGAGIYDEFEVVIASLEEGMEKPDTRLFHMTLEKLGVDPDEAAHVGDDPIDDLKGARDAGMRAVLIDRSRKAPPSPPYISSLSQLPEALGWTD